MSEHAARQAIAERFVEMIESSGEIIFNVDEATVVASSYGVYPPEPFAEAELQRCLHLYLGRCWGVGPDARWRDKLAVNMHIWWGQLTAVFKRSK